MWLTSAQGLSSFISLILHLAVRTCHVVAHCKSILTVSYTGFLLIHCVSTLIHKVSRQREKGVLHWVSGGGRYHCKATNVFSQRVLHNYNVGGFLQLEAVITKSLEESWLLVNPHSPPPIFLCATGTMRIHTSLGNCWGRLSACRIASSAIMLVMIID